MGAGGTRGSGGGGLGGGGGGWGLGGWGGGGEGRAAEASGVTIALGVPATPTMVCIPVADTRCTPANTMPTTDVCIDQCKLVGRGKRKQHIMIQCTSRARWYHNDCVAVKKDDIIDITSGLVHCVAKCQHKFAK